MAFFTDYVRSMPDQALKPDPEPLLFMWSVFGTGDRQAVLVGDSVAV